jgi:hypothetical protein
MHWDWEGRRWDRQSAPPKFLPSFGLSSAMSTASTSAQSLLEELDARQNEILDQLEELNSRIERVLKECVPAKDEQLRIAAE